jgi:hypothetical protein
MMNQNSSQAHPGRSKWVFIGFMVIAVYFLWTEHRAHVLGALPYLMLLACPLMHLFHHGGHHNHGSDHHKPEGHKENE